MNETTERTGNGAEMNLSRNSACEFTRIKVRGDPISPTQPRSDTNQVSFQNTANS